MMPVEYDPQSTYSPNNATKTRTARRQLLIKLALAVGAILLVGGVVLGVVFRQDIRNIIEPEAVTHHQPAGPQAEIVQTWTQNPMLAVKTLFQKHTMAMVLGIVGLALAIALTVVLAVVVLPASESPVIVNPVPHKPEPEVVVIPDPEPSGIKLLFTNPAKFFENGFYALVFGVMVVAALIIIAAFIGSGYAVKKKFFGSDANVIIECRDRVFNKLEKHRGDNTWDTVNPGGDVDLQPATLLDAETDRCAPGYLQVKCVSTEPIWRICARFIALGTPAGKENSVIVFLDSANAPVLDPEAHFTLGTTLPHLLPLERFYLNKFTDLAPYKEFMVALATKVEGMQDNELGAVFTPIQPVAGGLVGAGGDSDDSDDS